MKKIINWSKYQLDIFDNIKNGKSNIVILAVAGSGKSYTLVESVKYIPKKSKILFVAFNKKIAEELDERINKSYVDVMTLHSLGYKAIKTAFGSSVTLDPLKTQNIIKSFYEKPDEHIAEMISMDKAIGLCKAFLIDTPSKIDDLLDQFGVDTFGSNREDFIKKIIQALKLCKDNRQNIDYNDMIWFPFVYNMSVGKWDYIFVDETQDLNIAQIFLVLSACKKTSRVIACGDPMQCVEENTIVNTNGKLLPIKEVNVGDEILSFYEDCLNYNKVVNKVFSNWDFGFKIITESEKTLTMSPNHKIWAISKKLSTSNEFINERLFFNGNIANLITASDLHSGMKVISVQDNKLIEDEIISVEIVRDKKFVDIEVDKSNNFFGNGILSHNSIYGWRGADTNAINNLIEKLSAKTLPLSVNYRCGKSIVKMAQTYVPTIEAHKGATDGYISNITESEFLKTVRPGDFVISRTNAPLLKYCMSLLKIGIPANIVGRDIGANLSFLIKKSNKRNVDTFLKWLEEWKENEIKRLISIKRSTENVIDRYECLISLSENTKLLEDIHNNIDKLFRDDDNSKRVLFLTCHKSKGLENKRVFLLNDTFKPHYSQEEQNIYYVAITRAKEELYLVKKNV